MNLQQQPSYCRNQQDHRLYHAIGEDCPCANERMVLRAPEFDDDTRGVKGAQILQLTRKQYFQMLKDLMDSNLQEEQQNNE